jgi:hypothetical protein
MDCGDFDTHGFLLFGFAGFSRNCADISRDAHAELTRVSRRVEFATHF